MAKANQVSIPYVDPSVQHVGISRLRALNVSQLRALDKTLVIQDNDEPLAVLLKYEHFLAMQERLGERRMATCFLWLRARFAGRSGCVYGLALVGLILGRNIGSSIMLARFELGVTAFAYTDNRGRGDSLTIRNRLPLAMRQV